jgi:Sigma-70, region 4
MSYDDLLDSSDDELNRLTDLDDEEGGAELETAGDGGEEGTAAPQLAAGSSDVVAAVDGVELPPTSRKVRRRGRRTRMRAKTIAMKRLTKEELRIGALMYPTPDVPRPFNRAECKDAPRPCPWVSCKHHLYLDVNPETGSIKLNFPDLEVWEMKETCALDVADRGGITLEEVGEILNLTRERIRQVEVRGLGKMKEQTDSEK